MIANTTHVRVRYADTDKMGISYYSKYLEWFEVGRTELLREIDFPYSKMEEEGIGLPVIEVHCRYHRAALYDQLLRVVSAVESMPRGTVRIDYKIYNDDKVLLVEGYTIHSFLGKLGRSVRPPKSFLEALQPYFKEEISQLSDKQRSDV
jgi:acyl-CoA thioester hydrolase